MKYSFYFLAAIILIASTSCQKETDTPGPGTIDSLKAILPKQIIYTDLTFPPGTGTDIFSIKYDTANGKIDVYLDDTTNANPYDLLEISYTYNSSGYLVSYKKFNSGQLSEESFIERSADNKITRIAYEEKNYSKDTILFSYQIAGGQTKINTIEKFYYQANPPSINNYSYTYDAGNKLTHSQVSGGGLTTVQYNANSSIKKTIYADVNYSNETNLFYTSGISDGKEDAIVKTFLGKDYYMPFIGQYYYLSIFYDNEYISVSATDPYHPTRIQSITNNSGSVSTEERSLSYELNAQQLLSRVTGSLNGVQDAVIRFKY
jgi:hypothetical protein